MYPESSFSLIPCQSPLWAPDRHSQTILGDILPSPPLENQGRRWVLDLPDGDKIVCRVYEQDSPWVVTLFHGLTGSADAKYVQRVARDFLKAGHSVVLMNHRNCGEGKGLARHPYHCGRSDDLGFVISEVRKRFPRKKILSVGFSMSANALLLLMSRIVPPAQIFDSAQFDEVKGRMNYDLPDLALTVNSPLHLEQTSNDMSQSLNRIYQFSFMASIHFLIRELTKQGVLAPTQGLHPLMRVTQFEDRFTAPRSGFESGEQYREICSSQNYVQKIDRPTVCLMSQNDPFIDSEIYLETKFSPWVRLHFEKCGGHMGYLHKEKTPLGSFRWLDYGVHEISRQMMAEA